MLLNSGVYRETQPLHLAGPAMALDMCLVHESLHICDMSTWLLMCLQDITEPAGKAGSERRGPGGLQRINSAKSVAPSQAPYLRRGGPTSSRKER